MWKDSRINCKIIFLVVYVFTYYDGSNAVECTHNTKGLNCDKCEDLYNDLEWKPAVGKQTNACRKCNCNNHATSCHFDHEVFEASGKVSGGVCDNCQHNTMGKNCEQCQHSYYQDPSRNFTDPDVCVPCDCDPSGSIDNFCDVITGQCNCRRNLTGRTCNQPAGAH